MHKTTRAPVIPPPAAGAADGITAVRRRKAGLFRYFTKPIKVNEFTDALDKALGLTDR